MRASRMKATSETMLPSEHLWAMMEASKVRGNLIVMNSEHTGKDPMDSQD